MQQRPSTPPQNDDQAFDQAVETVRTLTAQIQNEYGRPLVRLSVIDDLKARQGHLKEMIWEAEKVIHSVHTARLTR